MNSQGCNARSDSNGVPSPIGLPFHIKSSGSRNRTCVWAINSRLPVPTQDPPEYVSLKSGWSDLNRRSRAPEARVPKKQHRASLSHTLIIEERPARIELAIPPWQGDGLPLHHGRHLLAQPNCQRSRAPSENRTHAAALRKRCHSTRPSVPIHSVGSVGIEPTLCAGKAFLESPLCYRYTTTSKQAIGCRRLDCRLVMYCIDSFPFLVSSTYRLQPKKLQPVTSGSPGN